MRRLHRLRPPVDTLVQMNTIVPPRVDQVLRALDPSRFRMVEHGALGAPIRSVADFANAMGVGLDRVAKTVLVAHAGSAPADRIAEPIGAYALVCLPGSCKINLTAVAQNLNWAGCELAKTTELLEVFGLKPGGVSPIGLGDVPLIVDQDLLSLPTIFVGSGAIGIDIELDPRDLVILTKASVHSIASA